MFLTLNSNWKELQAFQDLSEYKGKFEYNPVYVRYVHEIYKVTFLTSQPTFSSYLVRQKVEEIIKKKLVFPNKITKRFSKAIEAAELKSIEPAVSD